MLSFPKPDEMISNNIRTNRSHKPTRKTGLSSARAGKGRTDKGQLITGTISQVIALRNN